MKRNNFTMVRLIASVFVFAGHMGVLLNGQPPLLGSYPVQELGVGILFLISGYLITMSWLSDPNPLRYGIRRFFRLWPPFAVMILLMVFATGPLLSDLGITGYFRSGYQVYLKNLRFFIIYALPGVFSDLPLSHAVNGSLWTMPVEAFLYLVTPVLATVLCMKRRSRRSLIGTIVLTAAVLGLELYIQAFGAEARPVCYATDLKAAYHLIVFYMMGILYTYEEVRRYLNLQVGCAALFLLLLFQFSPAWMQFLALYLILPYVIFSFVFAPNPRFCILEQGMELSYGIYLYGFFFQQCVVSLNQQYGWNLSFLEACVLSAVPTLTAAVLSCVLIERPVMRLSRFLTKNVFK